MGLRAVKKLVVEQGGVIHIMNEREYLKAVRTAHFLSMPKFLGTLNPQDKTSIEWEEYEKVTDKIQPVTEPARVVEPKRLNRTQKSILTNLVLENVEMLANKGVNNFVNNFDELILKNI